jgi:probable rRNA maturation factor
MNPAAPDDIEVTNPSAAPWVDADLLRRVVGAALQRCGVSRACISVAVVGDAQIAELHERYCGLAGPTDVLTFDLGDPATKGEKPVEGEIVASADTAERVARERGHTAAAELALYAVHGTLHLAGHDDHDPQQAALMHALENEILAACGVGPVYGNY